MSGARRIDEILARSTVRARPLYRCACGELIERERAIYETKCWRCVVAAHDKRHPIPPDQLGLTIDVAAILERERADRLTHHTQQRDEQKRAAEALRVRSWRERRRHATQETTMPDNLGGADFVRVPADWTADQLDRIAEARPRPGTVISKEEDGAVRVQYGSGTVRSFGSLDAFLRVVVGVRKPKRRMGDRQISRGLTPAVIAEVVRPSELDAPWPELRPETSLAPARPSAPVFTYRGAYLELLLKRLAGCDGSSLPSDVCDRIERQLYYLERASAA